MAKIEVLSPIVAERIAAGEVIERPASVVKELVENALDASATEIAVILEDGGKALIEVIDNGSGMDRYDLSIAVQRHATSKLRSVEDLDRIDTLGFRGEALPSIAAVSQLSIISRAKDAAQDPKNLSTAYRVQVQATQIPRAEAMTFGHFLGSPHGTSMRSEALFSQIPARLKFLKSASSEVSHVREWLERIALTHPHVGFRLVHNDRTMLQFRPQTEPERVRAVLADGEDYPLVTAKIEADTVTFSDLPAGIISLRLHWLQGSSLPQMRKLVQVVNRRAVRDRLLQQALLSPFRQALLPGQFPAVALFLDLKPSELDVNVHPAKTEVRFLESGKIFRQVSKLVEKMILDHGAPAFAAGAANSVPSRAWTANARPNSLFEWKAAEPSFPGEGSGENPNAASTFSNSTPGGASSENREESWPPSLSDKVLGAMNRMPGELNDTPHGFALHREYAPPETTHPLAAALPGTSPLSPRHPLSGARWVGSLFRTYLLYDLGEELALVDQHAAHERVRYELLRNRVRHPQPSQALLIPEAAPFPAEWRAEIEARLPLLEQIGFEVELFGEEVVLFRAIPSEWGTDDLRMRLKNLIERLHSLPIDTDTTASGLVLDESHFEKLASEACHSAIRAGDPLTREGADALLEQLFTCEHPWNCPHGRPTVARVPKARFEEWFLRKV